MEMEKEVGWGRISYQRKIALLGTPVCEKLRIIYFNDVPWIKCSKDVANKFTELKKIFRKFYPKDDELNILIKLSKFESHDIREMFEL